MAIVKWKWKCVVCGKGLHCKCIVMDSDGECNRNLKLNAACLYNKDTPIWIPSKSNPKYDIPQCESK